MLAFERAPRAEIRAARDPLVDALLKTGGLKGKRLLDVGCSHGQLLIKARMCGALPTGMDMDVSAVRFVREKLGIEAICGNIENVVLDRERYDVITGLDLIEHLINPYAAIKNLTDGLKPGGRLVFVTPNGGLISYLGTEWIGFRVDLEHLQYFSPQSLTSLLQRTGTQPITIEEMGFPALSGLLTRRQNGDQLRKSGSELSLGSRLHRFIDLIRDRLTKTWADNLAQGFEGYHLRVIARKSGY